MQKRERACREFLLIFIRMKFDRVISKIQRLLNYKDCGWRRPRNTFTYRYTQTCNRKTRQRDASWADLEQTMEAEHASP